MSVDTKMSANLEISDLVDNLDKAAAKFDSFAKSAESSMSTIDKSAESMSNTQKRAYEVIKRSCDSHIGTMRNLISEYEALRQKQKNNETLTLDETVRLKELSKQFRDHIGAIRNNANELSRLSRENKTLTSSLTGAGGCVNALTSAFGGLYAIIATKIGSLLGEFAAGILNVGLQTQQMAAQFGAMSNNMTSAAATYQAFNDVARNTNYDFNAVYEMGKQLLNMGYSAKNAADLIQLCSDTAAGLGKDVSGAQQLITTISRIQATGKMSERQLMELQMAGIDLNAVFAPIGMSGEAAMQALKDGTMDSQKAISALTSYMHGFDGKMAESKQNIIDQWGDVTGNLTTMCSEIGASIADAFMKSEIVQDLIDFTQSLLDLVRGEGCGVFELLGDIAEGAFSLLDAGLKIVTSAIKLVIVVANEMVDAFKEAGRKIYSYLSWLLEPLGQIFSIVTQLLAKIGKEIKSEIDSSFSEIYKPKIKVEDTGNNFKQPVNTAGIKATKRSSASNKLTDEEKAVESLIKKYSDASKMAQERSKVALQAAAINISTLSGENQKQQELANKLATLKLNHDGIIAGYEKELALASKIADTNVREGTISEINKQIAAQDALYEAQVKAANFNALQNKSKDIVATAFGDSDTLQYKLNEYKSKLATFMQEINALDAGSMVNGQSTLDAQGVSSGISSQSMGFMAKMLKSTPEELMTDFEAKKTQFDSFAEYIQTRMAEATAAESQNLTIGQQWANKQLEWIGQIGSSMSDAMMSWINGSKTIGQAMADMVKELLQNAAKLLTQWLSIYALVTAFIGPRNGALAANKMVLGIGDGVKLAQGGYVRGIGTSVSDSIPAMLSNGEYVINAAAVDRLGLPYLNALNRGYADGGLVGGWTPPTVTPSSAAASSSVNLTMQVSAVDANSFRSFLDSGGLDEIRQALYDNEREFGTKARLF